MESGITYDNVIHVVILKLGGQVNINLYPVLGILFFNGVQERVKPFGTPKVPDDPSEVDFGEASMLGIVEVVHSIPDRLEDPAITAISTASSRDESSERLTKQTE